MSEIDTDKIRAVIEGKRDAYGGSPMMDRVEEMVDEIDRLQDKLDQWQTCAVTAVERMTGRTWDDDPEGISPGQLASIAGQRIRGHAVDVLSLTDDESIALQSSGVGEARRMGCGVFEPTEMNR